MKGLPTGTRGKLVALGILLILVIAGAKFVLTPIVQASQRIDDEIFDMQKDIERMHLLLSRAPSLKGIAARLKANNPLDSLTLRGGNAALAAAELQQLIRDAARDSDVRIVSLRVSPSATGRDHLDRVNVEVRLRAGTPGLRNILFALENSKPYIFFKQLAIRGHTATRPGSRLDNLDIRLEVYGMRVNEYPEQAPGG